MPASTFDLDAYFDRLGYRGSRSPTLSVLRELVERHALTIPFENIDVLLGVGVRLDAESIQDKLVRAKRGGYCFEHNTLFAGMLREVGFDVTTLAARVRWMVPPEVVTPRTHMLLSVSVEGSAYLVDVGFGGVSVTAPLDMNVEGEQPTLFEPQRIVRNANRPVGNPTGRSLDRQPAGNPTGRSPGHLLQAQISGEWRDLYLFTDEPQFATDYELANWFTSTHPSSRFKLNLIASKAHKDGRHVLFNRELSVYTASGIEKRAIDDPDTLLAVLETSFGLSFPRGTRLGAPGSAWAS